MEILKVMVLKPHLKAQKNNLLIILANVEKFTIISQHSISTSRGNTRSKSPPKKNDQIGRSGFRAITESRPISTHVQKKIMGKYCWKDQRKSGKI